MFKAFLISEILQSIISYTESNVLIETLINYYD